MPVLKISTITDLWYIYKHEKHKQYIIPTKILTDPVSSCQVYIDDNKRVDSISIFKEGISPMWEDPANKDGNTIHYRLSGGYDLVLLKQKVDYLWFNLLLILVEQKYDFSEKVYGIRIVDKCQSVLS